MAGEGHQVEERRAHTRLLKLALGVEESRAYWSHIDPASVAAPEATRAFEQRWFGAKSLRRVRVLLTNMRARYDAFPQALRVLCVWKPADPATRRAICHWHLQLSDPIYRRFSSEFLGRRRELPDPSFGRPTVVRWVGATFPDRWGSATVIQFASKLLSAASEAGVITAKRDPRTPLHPKVPDQALGYLLYLLRQVTFEGSLTHNPYLASVGLEGSFLEQKLRTLPGIDYRRMIDVDDFGWAHPSLSEWAEATL